MNTRKKKDVTCDVEEEGAKQLYTQVADPCIALPGKRDNTKEKQRRSSKLRRTHGSRSHVVVAICQPKQNMLQHRQLEALASRFER